MPIKDTCKPFLSYEEQLELLKSRKLIINDDVEAIKILTRVNYYRLSAYSLTLRQNDLFYPNTTLEDIMELYDFDVDFRKLVMQYCAYDETAIRAFVAYYHAEKHGPIGYLNSTYFENEWYHAQFINKLNGYLKKSSDIFIIHHRLDKGEVYPIWVAVEETTFSMMSQLYKNLLKSDRAAIANTYYGKPREYVESCLHCASVARNIAAHGGRFYNRAQLSPAVKFPKRGFDNVSNNRSFAYIYAIYSLLPEERKNQLILDVEKLFHHHPFAKLEHLGFPQRWQDKLMLT